MQINDIIQNKSEIAKTNKIIIGNATNQLHKSKIHTSTQKVLNNAGDLQIYILKHSPT